MQKHTDLKEKAKTGVEIYKGVEGIGGQRFAEGKWVRLEDARQEINRHITCIGNLGKSLREIQTDYERLRQGIIDIHNTLKNSPLGDAGDEDGLYYISIKEWAPIMHMFDKILKRKKAKP